MGRLIEADKPQDYFWDNRSKLFQSKDCRIAIDNAPTVEAIPKADYENRLKADMVAMLTELKIEIEKMKMQSLTEKEIWNNAIGVCSGLIQQKIDKLKEVEL